MLDFLITVPSQVTKFVATFRSLYSEMATSACFFRYSIPHFALNVSGLCNTDVEMTAMKNVLLDMFLV